MQLKGINLSPPDPGHSVRREVCPVRKYELVFILKADQPESEMEARVQRTAAILAEHNGEITKQDHWGIRRLAYEIENQDKGNYMLLKFKSDETVVKDLDRAFRLDDMILRHLIVKDEEWQERNRAAADKRRRAAAEAKEASAND